MTSFLLYASGSDPASCPSVLVSRARFQGTRRGSRRESNSLRTTQAPFSQQLSLYSLAFLPPSGGVKKETWGKRAPRTEISQRHGRLLSRILILTSTLKGGRHCCPCPSGRGSGRTKWLRQSWAEHRSSRDRTSPPRTVSGPQNRGGAPPLPSAPIISSL